MPSRSSSIGRSPALCGLVSLLTTSAVAQSYDLRIEKLGNPASSSEANTQFRSFARLFGAAMASTTLGPPETLGHLGFSIAADVSVVDFRANAAAIPIADAKGLTGPLLMPSVHLRKGLPWSFEVGARAAWIEKSHMGVGTLELKWAVNEGYKFLPDLGVRGHISKLLNARNLDLVAGGLDLSVGKAIAIAGMVTVGISVGWNLVFVGASTGTIDFNPGSTLAESDSSTKQFTDHSAFESLSPSDNAHSRFYGGVRVGGGIVQLGLEVSYSLLGKVSGQQQEVVAWNSSLGLQF